MCKSEDFQTTSIVLQGDRIVAEMFQEIQKTTKEDPEELGDFQRKSRELPDEFRGIPEKIQRTFRGIHTTSQVIQRTSSGNSEDF